MALRGQASSFFETLLTFFVSRLIICSPNDYSLSHNLSQLASKPDLISI